MKTFSILNFVKPNDAACSSGTARSHSRTFDRFGESSRDADPSASALDQQHECAALFERAVRGDSDAATQLYSRCVPPLRAWLSRRLPFHMAEEIAHDALVEAFRRNDQFMPGTRFQAWLKTIAWNGALNRLRTSSRRMMREQAYVEQERRVAATAAANPAPALEVMSSCVEALPVAQRELLRLHYDEGQTSRQIALAKGRSRSAVAVNLHRICKGLRRDIDRALRGAVGMALVALCAGIISSSAQASIAYGSINNFDTVNDTGHECHGFEIELEDCHSTDITYTYNYNHYGVPQITEDNSVAGHPKCLIRWESKKNADGSWAAYTAIPAGPIAPTNGHMFTNPAVNFGGEHFGVGYRVQPTVVHYFWLIDNGAGALVHGGAVQVSTPSFTYFPPVAGGNPAPAQVQAAIAPPPPPAPEPKEFGKAVWVKEIRTTTHNNRGVKLRDLVSDDPEDPNDKNWRNGEPDEVEMEWQILQKDYNKADGGANNELQAAPEDLPGGDEVVTRRYEFYKYTGPLDNETGEAMASAVAADGVHGVGTKIINGANVDLSGVEVVGDYTGSQMAAVDVDAPVGLIDHVGEARINTPFAARRLVIEGALPFTCIQEGALPAGMTFDEVTGILAGTPSTSGEFGFKVTASDGVNPDVSKNYTLIVAAAGEALPPVSLLDTTAAPVDAGTTTGDGSYVVGESATVTATAVPGFSFLNWTDNGAIVSTNTSYTLTMDVNHSLVANFVAQASYTVSTESAPAAGGTTSGGGSVASGANATVTAVANAGYSFANWTRDGAVVSSNASYTFPVTANQLLIANFVPTGGSRTIATSSNPAAGGTTAGGGTYADGASVTVTAVPNANYIFKRWQEAGVTVNSSASYTFTATADRVLVAKFAAIYPVTTSASPAQGGSTTVTGTFEDGDSVTVLATANPGFTFLNWTLNGTVVSASASYSFNANPARNLVANFSGPPATYTINTSANPLAGGNTSGGGVIAAGSSVTLSAIANAGYEFVHWTTAGDVEVSASASYTFTPTESGDYVAHFAPSSVGIPFDFDTAIPVPALNQVLPIDQTSLGLTATFSSPEADAFRVRTKAASGQTLAKFSGNYLEGTVDAATLSIQLAQPVTGVSMDFATVEPLNVPLPSDLQITAIDNSSGAPIVVGTAIAHGVVAAGDSLPVGTISLNTAGSSFDEITVQLPALPQGAQRFLIDNVMVSPGASTGGTMLLANPNWNITLTDFGYSDFLLDNTPGFEGREYLSGEWGSAIAYQRNGHTEGPTWLEPNFMFPDWKTNSNFQTVSGIHLVGSNADGLPIAESIIANNDLQITLRFEMIDTVIGTPMGITAVSAAGGGASINSNRYVLNQTFVVKNISGTTISNVQLFQLLHGFISQRGQYDNRSYGGQLSQYHFDTTMSGIDANAAGGQSSNVGLEDLIGFHSKVAPTAFEMGHYGIEGNGIDDHAVGKPSDGVHLSVEDNWQRAPYDTRLGRDQFAPTNRWIAGAQRWELGTLEPGQSATFDLLLSLLTGTKVAIEGGGNGGSTGRGSCNGGSSHVGGVDFEFEDINEEGTFFGEFSEADDAELMEREGYGEFLLPTFATPQGNVHQLWELEYSGTFTGNIHLTFAYNPALLPAGYDENQLAIYHFRDGVWEKLDGRVDTLNHLIHVVTASLSPFALGINDVVVKPRVDVSADAPDSIRVTWPASFTDWILQESPDMSLGSWVNSAHPVSIINDVKQALVPISGGGTRFFRLIKP